MQDDGSQGSQPNSLISSCGTPNPSLPPPIRASKLLHYNQSVKTWDVVIIGGGVIGLSLAWRLKRDGVSVLVVEKGEPAREATYAAGGMIAHCDPHNPPELADIIAASASMYPEFVRELRDEAFESPDLRDAGTIAFFAPDEAPTCDGARVLDEQELSRREPAVTLRGRAYFLPERSVDPRKLGSALEKAARNRGADFATGSRGNRSRGARRPYHRRAHNEIVLRRRQGGELRRSLGRADQSLWPADASGKRPDGVRRAASRSPPIRSVDRAHGAHPRGVHHPAQRWPHRFGRDRRGGRLR